MNEKKTKKLYKKEHEITTCYYFNYIHLYVQIWHQMSINFY